jgi:hypothetical protein
VSSGVVPHEIEALVALRSPLQIIREPSKGIAALESLKTGRLA